MYRMATTATTATTGAWHYAVESLQAALDQKSKEWVRVPLYREEEYPSRSEVKHRFIALGIAICIGLLLWLSYLSYLLATIPKEIVTVFNPTWDEIQKIHDNHAETVHCTCSQTSVLDFPMLIEPVYCTNYSALVPAMETGTIQASWTADSYQLVRMLSMLGLVASFEQKFFGNSNLSEALGFTPEAWDATSPDLKQSFNQSLKLGQALTYCILSPYNDIYNTFINRVIACNCTVGLCKETLQHFLSEPAEGFCVSSINQLEDERLRAFVHQLAVVSAEHARMRYLNIPAYQTNLANKSSDFWRAMHNLVVFSNDFSKIPFAIQNALMLKNFVPVSFSSKVDYNQYFRNEVNDLGLGVDQQLVDVYGLLAVAAVTWPSELIDRYSLEKLQQLWRFLIPLENVHLMEYLTDRIVTTNERVFISCQPEDCQTTQAAPWYGVVLKGLGTFTVITLIASCIAAVIYRLCRQRSMPRAEPAVWIDRKPLVDHEQPSESSPNPHRIPQTPATTPRWTDLANPGQSSASATDSAT
mmetsp:Transcript_134739/g.233652  ORF Transcript_134739/g.233652 Transcript_134739/m.233652 type:complete len:528 (-) Transcript_134739:346-1929(-)